MDVAAVYDRRTMDWHMRPAVIDRRYRDSRSRPLLRRFVPLRYFRPIHNVPPCLEVIRPAVLVFQVIRVFPNVDAEDRFVAVHQWTVLIRRGHDLQFAALI